MALFDDSYLIRGKDFKVSDIITVFNPKISDILDFGENNYYRAVSMFISTPQDYKVQLFDMGIDFEQMNGFEFFYVSTRTATPELSSILFGDLDFSAFSFVDDPATGNLVMKHEDILFDELSYTVASDFIRKINNFPEQKPEVYLNDDVKRYRLDVERGNLRHKQREAEKKKGSEKSQLLSIISALVNSGSSPYDYKSIMDITISQLHDSVNRVQKIKHYDDVMRGLYAGTLQQDKLDLPAINWLS